MSARTKLFAWIAIGGALTLGSYVWGVMGYPELRDGMWGGVPESVKPLYTINMFLAAFGFLIAMALLLKYADDALLNRLFLPYTLILIPSALWLPLTVWYLQSAAGGLWWAIRIDLFLVGIGAIMLWPAIGKLSEASGNLRHIGRTGLFFFILQTAVLDAILWPAWFVHP